MPLPTPKGQEDQDTFISRCAEWMADNESGKPQDQRLAICYSQWRDAKEEFVQSVPDNVLKEFIASDKSASDFISSIVEKQEESEPITQDDYVEE